MFKCLSNCAKCCGCVPIQRTVINRNRTRLQRRYRKIELADGFIHPITGDGYCIFLHKTTFDCQIYNERPEICMKYGTIPELPCPYITMNGVERTEKEIKDTIEQNSRTVDERLGAVSFIQTLPLSPSIGTSRQLKTHLLLCIADPV